MPRLAHKVAIVTGAATPDGIGAASARALAREGASVIVTDIADAEPVAAAIRDAGGQALSLCHDVTAAGDWRRAVDTAVERFGGLDVLVNNAGIGANGGIEDVDLDTYRRIFAVNMDSVFLSTQIALPALRKSASASIVNISSAGGIVGEATSAVYNASKAAIRLFSKSVALEAARKGWPIRVNSIHPGLIGTASAFQHVRQAMGGSPEQALAMLKMRIPMGRPGTPDEVAFCVVYLASDEAAYTTGTEFIIDGGLTAE